LSVNLELIASKRFDKPSQVLKLTPLEWLKLSDLLSAISSALTHHDYVYGYQAVKGVVRELALNITLLLTVLGLRADIVTATVDDIKVTYVDLLDCSCKLRRGDRYVVVRCDCGREGFLEYPVELPTTLNKGVSRV
jgi:hypothetical protein